MPLFQEQAAFRTGTAVVAQVPNNTISGGNARGANAVDWQTTRGSAAQVASATNSVISGGISNQASGNTSTIAGGQDNVMDGTLSWCPGGSLATARGRWGVGVWASGFFAARGDAQALDAVLRRQTTDATPTRLTADNAAAGAANTINIPDNCTLSAIMIVEGRQTTAGGGRYKHHQFVLLSRDAGAGSVTIATSTAGVLSLGVTVGWAVSITADTTNGGLAVTVTGVAATNINWVARVIAVEVVG